MRSAMWMLALAVLLGAIGLREGVSEETPSPPSPESIDKGKKVFDKHRCMLCHREGGLGKPLAGVGARLKREEVRTWIADPKKIKPKTVMPKLPLKEDELDAVTDYVMSLK